MVCAMRKPWLLGIFPLLAVACARHPASPSEVLDQAARDSLGAAPSARALSLSGFHAYRIAQPGRALEAALKLTEAAPRHPLAVIGARSAFDLAGAAASFDDAILAHATRALQAGLRGDAAYLLRSAAGIIHSQRENSAAQAQILSELGVADQLTLLGPFSPFHVLGFDVAIPPEQTGGMGPGFVGPF